MCVLLRPYAEGQVSLLSIYSLFGSRRYELCADDSARVLDICRRLSVTCEYHAFSESSFFCSVPIFSCKAVEDALKCNGVKYKTVSDTGMLPLLLRHRRRAGIFVGALILMCVTAFSPYFLWNIDVKGNSEIELSELFETLESAGLYLGCYLPHVDVDSIESAALVKEKRLSWISVNINGNTAYVEIRETTEPQSEQRDLPYANIIAAEGAIVTEMEVFSGVASVKCETYVRKGELLISGVISKEALGTHLTYARGKVYGKNFKEFEIEIPYSYSTLAETGKSKYGLNFRFFSKSFFVPPIGALYENFSEHVKVYALKEGTKSLPVLFETVEYRECAYVSLTRSERKAAETALEELNRILTEEFSNAEILSRKIEYYTGEKSVILTAEVWYEREIGCTVEFEAIE